MKFVLLRTIYNVIPSEHNAPAIYRQSTDEGDGIVPCTPTLPIHRHDDSYQSISSPRIPAGGPPIRFRFEDVAAPQASLEAVPGGSLHTCSSITYC
ncbi:unnamed protein product [Clavelina lepadiformis]|uniref:Uncharacterized protein n=1 Tax=Clavelina lepadiformis TaxID=159417 RepID=A0ABP0GZ50_CLALP